MSRGRQGRSPVRHPPPPPPTHPFIRVSWLPAQVSRFDLPSRAGPPPADLVPQTGHAAPPRSRDGILPRKRRLVSWICPGLEARDGGQRMIQLRVGCRRCRSRLSALLGYTSADRPGATFCSRSNSFQGRLSSACRLSLSPQCPDHTITPQSSSGGSRGRRWAPDTADPTRLPKHALLSPPFLVWSRRACFRAPEFLSRVGPSPSRSVARGGARVDPYPNHG